MSRKCDVCGRGPDTGFAVSHSNRHNKRRWLPNLQRVKVLEGGTPRRLHVCTTCLKAGKVRRAI